MPLATVHLASPTRPGTHHVHRGGRALIARDGLTSMLAAGEETPFNHPYKLREVLVERFIGYREYTKDTIRHLFEEGIEYSEQSVGLGKLAREFKPELVAEVQADLAKEGKKVDMRFLAMVSTTELAGDKASPDKRSKMREVLRDVLSRLDVIGLDVAGPEKGLFTEGGMENFRELYAIVSEVAKDPDRRGRPLVLRPHVGEGFQKKGDRRHVEIARKNLETMIKTLEDMGYNSAKAEQDGVIIRFGHATHATPEQLQRMAKLGIIVEANIGSNLITGSIATPQDHPLLYNLYYGVKTVASTDGGGVMRTDLETEHSRAAELIERFRADKASIVIDGESKYFSDLTPEEQARFSIDRVDEWTREYREQVATGDAADRAQPTRTNEVVK